MTESRFIFFFIIRCLEYLRRTIAVVLRIAAPLNFRIKKRQYFESKEMSSSFNLHNRIASFAFEVSSQGELEQIKPLLVTFLSKGYLIELVFSSESVEKNCENLAAQYQNLKIFRLNIVCHRPLNMWLTAPVIIFCRYDFYPEILLLKKNKKFILVAGALKNKDLTKITIYNYFLRNVYSLFDLIVTVTNKEKSSFTKYFDQKKILTYDFRNDQILKRINQHSFKFSNLKNCTNQNKVICGSYWPESFFLFNNDHFKKYYKEEKPLIFISPHELNSKNISIIKEQLSLFDIKEISTIEDIEKEEFSSGMYLISIQGILCELYSYFNIAYIDGGFGRSIHSVLEPFWSNNYIVVGPKVHRSSEYDYIVENCPNEVKCIENLLEFVNELSSNHKVDSQRRKNMSKLVKSEYNKIYKMIESNINV